MKTKLIIIIATTICQLSTANAAQAEDKAAVNLCSQKYLF